MNDKGKREDLCRTTSTGSAEKIKAEFQNWMNNTCNCSSNLLDPNISIKMSCAIGNRFANEVQCNNFERQLALYLKIRAYLIFKGYWAEHCKYERNNRLVYSREKKAWVVSTEVNLSLLPLYVKSAEQGQEVCDLLNYSKNTFDHLFI